MRVGSPIDHPGLEGVRERRFSLTVIGDVRMESRAELADRSFTDLNEDHFAYTSMRATISGSAINLAQHAVRYFRHVDMIAKIGDDAFNPIIHQRLCELGIGNHLVIEEGMRNGLTVMLRDTSGVRLLLASDRAPCSTLSEQDVQRKIGVLLNTDAVFSDGCGSREVSSGPGI